MTMDKKVINFREYFSRIKGTIFRVSFYFIAVIILVMVVYNVNFFNIQETLDQLFSSIFKSLSHLFREDGSIDTLSLILNNIRVAALALGVGFIPFIFLPVLILIVNAALLGVLLGFMLKQGAMPTIITFLAGVLPHGILELPAIFISIACGVTLCKTITKTIMRRDTEFTISEVLINSVKTIVFVCIPMLIVAGIIETQITPKLLMLFRSYSY